MARARAGGGPEGGGLKVGEVARRAGVPVGTVKFYLREGLLPPPLETRRNMAYYPAEAVERIRLVKELQEKRFLPLKVIRALFAESGARSPAGAGSGTIREALSAAAELALAGLGAESAEADPLAGGALTRAERRSLEAAGVLTAGPSDARWSPIDAHILRAVTELRRLGFTRRRGFGAERLIFYANAVRGLVTEELETILSDVAGKLPSDEAPAMLSRALDIIGDVIVQLRRKALLGMVEGLPRADATPRDA